MAVVFTDYELDCLHLGIAKDAELIESLRKDKARLDWLADRNNEIGNVLLPTGCVQNHLDDMRAAIDEAMQL